MERARRSPFIGFTRMPMKGKQCSGGETTSDFRGAFALRPSSSASRAVQP